MEGKYSYFGESMGTNFPGSCNLMDFASFSCAVENWWGNPSIFQVTKYTMGWESNGKKCSYYGKSMSTNFPESPPYDIIFLSYEKLKGKPMHFPYGEVYRRMRL